MRNLILALTFFITSLAHAALTDLDRSEIMIKNILTNAGFESGKGGWTASGGSFAIATSGSNLLTGKASATWDSGSSGQTFTSAAITIPNGLYARNGFAQCKILTPSGTATHTISVFDGSSTLVSTTVTSSTAPAMAGVNFIFPSSGTVAIRITSVASDEPSITIDDCYIGDAFNLTNVSQARFIGSLSYAPTASCTWSTSSTSFTNFAADTDCPSATVTGSITAPGTKIPAAVLSNAAPGNYMVVATFTGMKNGAGSAGVSFRIHDGTTGTSNESFYPDTQQPYFPVTLVGFFSYTTTQSSVTWNVQGVTGSAGNTAGVRNDDGVNNPNSQIEFKVYRFPTDSSIALTPDLLSNSWSGYHDTTCAWSRTGTTYADFTDDASCALVQRTNNNFGTVATSGASTPGIVFTPKRAGRYYVCANAKVSVGTTTADNNWQLTDGSTIIANATLTPNADVRPTLPMCGIYVASSTSSVTLKIQGKASSGTNQLGASSSAESAIEWSIYQIDQQIPNPVILNQVTNSTTSGVRVEAARLNCDASSAITAQQGSWISSIGNISSGQCTVTISGGIFSATPYCSSTSNAFRIIKNLPASATSITVGCVDDAGVAGTVCDMDIICVGPK